MSRARHEHKTERRAKGGGVGKIGEDTSTKGAKVYAGGESNVLKEAERRKRGGAIHGKKPVHVEGKEPRHHRLDRPGRKRGGAVGADSSPMTEAAHLESAEGEKKMSKTWDKEDD